MKRHPIVPVFRRNRVTAMSRGQPRDFPNVRKRPGYYLKGPAAAWGARQIISDNLPAAVKPYRSGLRSVIEAGYRKSRHDSSSFFVQLRVTGARRQAVIKSRRKSYCSLRGSFESIQRNSMGIGTILGVARDNPHSRYPSSLALMRSNGKQY